MNQDTFTTVAGPRKSVTTNDGVTLRYKEVGLEAGARLHPGLVADCRAVQEAVR
jgi:hypothetical protein